MAAPEGGGQCKGSRRYESVKIQALSDGAKIQGQRIVPQTMIPVLDLDPCKP